MYSQLSLTLPWNLERKWLPSAQGGSAATLGPIAPTPESLKRMAELAHNWLKTCFTKNKTKTKKHALHQVSWLTPVFPAK
jgi:hypothetical protein